MHENLVIVESPAKAKTIKKFLDDKFLVKSSYGHIRDLTKKGFGVDTNNDYKPEYVVPKDKNDIVKELKKLTKEAKTVWLASDEDREGEAIAWHLKETLGLDEKKTNRIVFHEITKDAILNAIKNPRKIDNNLVNAQQARRVLDRLVGFEVSPVLWRKVKPSLSAGRVQSVAVRLIVEREREIIAFKTDSFFRVAGNFVPMQGKEKFNLKAELNHRFGNEKETENFLKICKNAEYKIVSIDKKPAKKSPSPPFTTSTLQQEASRNFGFSVSQTMTVAQRLYEAGLITYMRTDSTNLSNLALETAKKTIEKLYGAEYSQTRRYKTKSKGAQEAHEAIRPAYIENQTIVGTAQEQKLYDLIWKRTVASQMTDASIERTVVNISVSAVTYKFQAAGEILLFDGFLRVYMESHDDEHEDNIVGGIPAPLKEGQNLSYTEIKATERFTHHPPRYSEASLVKKMEELGIGRPSTYAPTISTIVKRQYVSKEDRPGTERKYRQLTLTYGNVEKEDLKEITGTEKAKLFPSDIGILVNDFLIEHFNDIVDYNFTAKIEEEFDEIAGGALEWIKMIDNFYKPFHYELEKTKDVSRHTSGERILGVDPETGRQLSVRLGKFGPIAQIGTNDDAEKPVYASLGKGQLLETITLEEAIKLFDLPRHVGRYEGEDVTSAVGRFGPYIKFGKIFVSLKKDDDPFTVTQERSIELIEEKRRKDREKTISDFGDMKVLNGRFGAYIHSGGENYKIPKGVEAASLTENMCKAIVAEQSKATKKTKSAKTTKTKKTATEKTGKNEPVKKVSKKQTKTGEK